MGEEALIYLIVQALIAAKAMYFERLRQEGKNEIEIKKLWKDKWDTWKMQDPTLLPKV